MTPGRRAMPPASASICLDVSGHDFPNHPGSSGWKPAINFPLKILQNLLGAETLGPGLVAGPATQLDP